jgi:hypothetical protein
LICRVIGHSHVQLDTGVLVQKSHAGYTCCADGTALPPSSGLSPHANLHANPRSLTSTHADSRRLTPTHAAPRRLKPPHAASTSLLRHVDLPIDLLEERVELLGGISMAHRRGAGQGVRVTGIGLHRVAGAPTPAPSTSISSARARPLPLVLALFRSCSPSRLC